MRRIHIVRSEVPEGHIRPSKVISIEARRAARRIEQARRGPWPDA